MRYNKEELDDIAGEVLDASIAIHRELGPGLLESMYEHCLVYELETRGLQFQTQVILPILYKGKELPKKYRIDLLVENEVIVEIKAVEILLPVHEAQIISYLKLANKRLGLIINFNVPLLKFGFQRFVNGYFE